MAAELSVVISAAVEGDLDEAIVHRILERGPARMGIVYGKSGKGHLRRSIAGYNNAARFAPWLVLVDLDDDAECAPPLRAEWLPSQSQGMCFRVAVREVEAWLLADRERLSAFLGVPIEHVPREPEALPKPKEAMVELARRSRRREIREDMAPRPQSGRSVGPAYTSRLIQFVDDAESGWRPDVAARACDSLARCIASIRRLVQRHSAGRSTV